MLEAVVNNPFRVLGVWSNAGRAEIVRNLGRMKAFLNVGRTVSFPADLDGILPQLERTLQGAQDAQAALTLPADKIRHALFWFCKVTPDDEAALGLLASGIPEGGTGDDVDAGFEAILSREDTFSSLVNRAVLALVRGDYPWAVKAYFALLGDDSMREAFCTAVCDDTFRISAEELTHIVLDEIAAVAGMNALLSVDMPGSEWNYLKDKAISSHMSVISSAVAEARNVRGTIAPKYRSAAEMLIERTREPLEIIRGVLGEDDLRFQSLSDGVAKQLLDSSINYVNYSTAPDALKKGLEFQEYALSLACGAFIKERCRTNIEILRRRLHPEYSALIDSLGRARYGIPSIDRARKFIETSTPLLAKVKEEFGAGDADYIALSSAVAAAALQIMIDLLKRNPSSKSNFAGACEVTEKIREMDLNEETRVWVEKNYSSIRDSLRIMGMQGTRHTWAKVLGWIITGIIFVLWLINQCS